MAVEIRLGKPCDLPNVMTLVQACIQRLRSDNILQWDDIYPSWQVFAADIHLQSLYLAISNAKIVGTIAVDFEQPLEYQNVAWGFTGKILVVHRLCVDPHCWGQGIAASLMDFAEQRALMHNCSGIRLDAYAENSAALGLYQLRAYRVAGRVFFPRRLEAFYCFEKNLADDLNP